VFISNCTGIPTAGATAPVTPPARLLLGLKEKDGDMIVLVTSAADVNASAISRKPQILSRKTTTCSLSYLYIAIVTLDPNRLILLTSLES